MNASSVNDDRYIKIKKRTYSHKLYTNFCNLKLQEDDLSLLFFSHGYKLQDYVFDGCRRLKILSLNIRDVAFITVKDVDYFCIIHNISKSEAIHLSKESVLDDRGHIPKFIFKKAILKLNQSKKLKIFFNR